MTTLREDLNLTPLLLPMIETVNATSYGGKPLDKSNYVVMGQICIAKSHRGQAIFYQLYDFFKKQFQQEFDYVITFVSKKNTRSIRAHLKAGFEILNPNESDDFLAILLRLK